VPQNRENEPGRDEQVLVKPTHRLSPGFAFADFWFFLCNGGWNPGACWQFFERGAARGLELKTVRPLHVAAWIEDFPGSKPTIKQKLAAVRTLYDILVVRQITPSNPAHSVRGPKYVVKKGKTPVWSREDAKALLDPIPKDSVSGLRDLALIATMFYSFARVSAVLKLKIDDLLS
jgi:site-specific recombinase XerD